MDLIVGSAIIALSIWLASRKLAEKTDTSAPAPAPALSDDSPSSLYHCGMSCGEVQPGAIQAKAAPAKSAPAPVPVRPRIVPNYAPRARAPLNRFPVGARRFQLPPERPL